MAFVMMRLMQCDRKCLLRGYLLALNLDFRKPRFYFLSLLRLFGKRKRHQNSDRMIKSGKARNSVQRQD